MNREYNLRRRIRLLTWMFIGGLLIAGATAIPLRWEVETLARIFGVANQTAASTTNPVGHWLLTIRESLDDLSIDRPFLFYGTDWLAFGHFAIAIAFIGALRNPVRNRVRVDCVRVAHSVRICVRGSARNSGLVAND